MTLKRADPGSAGDHTAHRPGRPGRTTLVLLLAGAATAIGLLVWASGIAGLAVTDPEPVDVPPLVREPVTVPDSVAPAGSLQALLPDLPPNLRLVVPSTEGGALWDWPTKTAAAAPHPDFQPMGGHLVLHAGGRLAAELDREGSLLLGSVFERKFQGVRVRSFAWHVGGAPRIAWLSEPAEAGTAELWTADLAGGGLFSRLIGEVDAVQLGSPDIGDGGFLVAFGDWGFVIERSLPITTSGDVAWPNSQVMVVDPEGRPGPWRNGRLIAAAADGRLLVGTINVLSGTYSLELTGPDLAPGGPLPWVSIGHTSWSPNGRYLFNMTSFGPPTVRFSVTSEDADQRFEFDAQVAHPLGWSADSRYFMLGAIVPAGRQLVIVDIDAGVVVMAPVTRLPRNAGLG